MGHNRETTMAKRTTTETTAPPAATGEDTTQPPNPPVEVEMGTDAGAPVEAPTEGPGEGDTTEPVDPEVEPAQSLRHPSTVLRAGAQGPLVAEETVPEAEVQLVGKASVSVDGVRIDRGAVLPSVVVEGFPERVRAYFAAVDADVPGQGADGAVYRARTATQGTQAEV